ncbi:hypothetical protein [Streptacidiphilus sp. PAMC 29251]
MKLRTRLNTPLKRRGAVVLTAAVLASLATGGAAIAATGGHATSVPATVSVRPVTGAGPAGAANHVPEGVLRAVPGVAIPIGPVPEQGTPGDATLATVATPVG